MVKRQVLTLVTNAKARKYTILEALIRSESSIVEYRVNFKEMMMAQIAKVTAIMSSTTKPPSAHLATNQKSEAKQKVGGRMK